MRTSAMSALMLAYTGIFEFQHSAGASIHINASKQLSRMVALILAEVRDESDINLRMGL